MVRLGVRSTNSYRESLFELLWLWTVNLDVQKLRRAPRLSFRYQVLRFIKRTRIQGQRNCGSPWCVVPRWLQALSSVGGAIVELQPATLACNTKYLILKENLDKC